MTTLFPNFLTQRNATQRNATQRNATQRKFKCLLSFKALYAPLFVLIFHVLLSSRAFGQLTGQNDYVKSSIAPSPTAAALGKYGDIPVTEFTGVPNITIPLGSIDEGALSVPVTLSYHGGGVKVAELASWVGLSWSLQSNGMITRVIQGVADDDNSKYGYYHSGSALRMK